MDWLWHPDTWISLLTLTALEVVLGIDNVVFIAIVAAKLPASQQALARRVGLIAALVSRLALLFALSWIMGLTEPLFAVFGKGFSGRDLILLIGGTFLIGKATLEIYEKLELQEESHTAEKSGSFASVLFQIMFIDVIFSLDSVITAVGMASKIPIMVAAMILSVLVMLVAATPVSNVVDRHPSMKILALSFLLLIGVLLVAEGFGQHIDKAYIYFAMGFSLLIELLNMRFRRARAKPVHLHNRYLGT